MMASLSQAVTEAKEAPTVSIGELEALRGQCKGNGMDEKTGLYSCTR